MAVVIGQSLQLTDGYRKYPVDEHGKRRDDYFELPAIAVAGDAGSTYDICKLPPGRTRILPYAIRLWNSAFGAGVKLNMGLRAYYSRDIGVADPNAEDPLALVNQFDVSAALSAASPSTVAKFDVYSKVEPIVFITVTGGPIPIGATLRGYVPYIYE